MTDFRCRRCWTFPERTETGELKCACKPRAMTVRFEGIGSQAGTRVEVTRAELKSEDAIKGARDLMAGLPFRFCHWFYADKRGN